jgi:hypothetical protein
VRRGQTKLVREAKRRNAERYQRIRAACGNYRSNGISLDEHAARIVLEIEARVGQLPFHRTPTHADKKESK